MKNPSAGRRLLLISSMMFLAFCCLRSVPAGAQSAPWLMLTGPNSGYVEVQHDPDLNPTEVFTIETWLHPVSYENWTGSGCPSLVGKGFVDSYWLGLCSGHLRLYTHGSGSSRNSSGAVPLNEWTHVAAVYDGSEIHFYLDGVLDSSIAAEEGELPATESFLRIGSDVNFNVVPVAAMDDVRLWNTARSGDEIEGAMDLSLDDATPGLVSSWSFSFGDASDPVGGHDGVLVGDSMIGSDIPEANPCINEYFVPAGAHAPGDGGSVWRTDLHIFNRSSGGTVADVFLLPRNSDNTEPVSTTIDLEGNSTRAIEDVVLSEFGENSMAAAFRICSPSFLQIASRTYNKAEKGTFGQSIAGIRVDSGTDDGNYDYLIGLSENELFRTNLGWVNTSATAATLELLFYDSNSTVIGEHSVNVPPYGHGQINRVFKKATNDPVSNGRIQVHPVGSAMVIYASVVDNPTGDGTFMLAE